MKWVFNMLGLASRGARTQNMFFKFMNAREDPTMTNFLVSNPLFRSLAIGFHNKKENALNDIDQYLEKELLTPEEYNKLYKGKRIDENCKDHGSSSKNPNLRKKQSKK